MATTQEMLKQMVDDDALDIERVVAGTYDFDVDVDEFGNDENGNDLSTSYGRLANYFSDMLDVEFRVDACLRYKGVIVTLALGGPGIYLDTFAGEVRGYWGLSNEPVTSRLSSHAAAAIDDYFADHYDAMRGY